MKLGALAQRAGIALPSGDDAQVTGFAIDHRKVAPGTVFGAFVGTAVNGENFIPAAVAAGAVAVVARVETQVDGALHIAADNPRRAFAQLAAGFFTPVPGTIVAVTGTNGKTSCVEMTRQIWRMLGERAASIGTLGVTTADESISTGLTTPDIVTFLANMSGLAREGITHVAYDNPRSEDPAAIRAAILAGGLGKLRDGGERRTAIAAAIAQAGPDDIVLIAGKGHEQGQIIGTGEAMRVLPFDDVTVARECAA